MSLGRLLSLGGGVDKKVSASSRYKVLKGAIPDFGARQRSENATERNKDMNTESLFEAQQQASEPANAAEENTEMRILSVGVQPPKLNVLPMKETFWMKLKNFFRRGKAAAAAPRPVQTEWPMDRIVVVRNDLADSDYELVWSEASAQAKAGLKPKGEQLVGRAWKKVNPFAKKEKLAEQKPEAVEV